MKKLFLLGTVLTAGVVLVGCNHQNPVATAPTTAPVDNVVIIDNNEAPADLLASSNYIPYNPTALKEAQAKGKNTAVFFHSKTCGSCKKLDDNIMANAADISDDTVILKADWDENQDLARALKVEKYHTVAFVNTDGTSDNVKGLFTLNELEAAGKAAMESSKTISNNYQAYSDAAAKKLMADGKEVGVFFHSKTCGSCKKLDDNLTVNGADLPNNLVVLKADWDENQALAKELGVDKYHTVAFMNTDGTSNNVKGLFTAQDVSDAARPTNTIQSNYQEYSELAYKTADAQQKDVAVFFHSKTCGSCKKLDDNLTATIDTIPENTVILKAEWSENQELAKELGVDKYHTVAFMNTDGTSKNVKGLFTLEDILAAK